MPELYQWFVGVVTGAQFDSRDAPSIDRWQMIDSWDPSDGHFVQKTWQGQDGCLGECRCVSLLPFFAAVSVAGTTYHGLLASHENWCTCCLSIRFVLCIFVVAESLA